jgi:GNAT superfamily N-acetyltransferase
MTPRLVCWDRTELADRVDDVLDVYAEAMEVPRAAARSRRAVVAGHLDRAGLVAVAALDGDRLVGIAYGYRGAPGQWWHDQVRAAMAEDLAEHWLADPFEVCELHVRPELHGTGVGHGVLVELLSHTEAATAVLTTPDLDTRARRFYRKGGWVDLVRDLTFPGDPRAFAVLGLEL